MTEIFIQQLTEKDSNLDISCVLFHECDMSGNHEVLFASEIRTEIMCPSGSDMDFELKASTRSIDSNKCLLVFV